MGGLRYGLITSRSDSGTEIRKQAAIGPGERLRLCALEGAGRIVRFWMTLPLVGQRHVLKEAVLRIYWDGETDPSVEVPLGDFFGASFGQPKTLISERLVIAGGAYLCRFEMPFNRGALIELENQSNRILRDLFFQIGYFLEAPRAEPRATLHAQFRRENPTNRERPLEIVRASGQGWLSRSLAPAPKTISTAGSISKAAPSAHRRTAARCAVFFPVVCRPIGSMSTTR